MIDKCIALDQSVSPHAGEQAVFQMPQPHSFFWIAALPPKRQSYNNASCAGNVLIEFQRLMVWFCNLLFTDYFFFRLLLLSGINC